MKSLTLFRHAKTERDSESGRDFDRRLNKRGRGDSARMGKEIRALGLDFELVLCSPASRASETAELAKLSPRYDERIYDASAGQLLEIARDADSSIGRLMMVGHNPGFEQLASMLIGNSIEMPTGSLVEIEFPIKNWKKIERASGKLVRFVKPKELG